MDRIVNILRCRRTGNFLVHPFGTFRRYGGYVGINPYIEVVKAAAPIALGKTIVYLLQHSGPIDCEIVDAKDYLKRTADAQTHAIRKKHGLDSPKNTTSKLALKFLAADVEQRHKQKSWIVRRYNHDSRRRLNTGAESPPTRVKHREGAKALGMAVLELLKID